MLDKRLFKPHLWENQNEYKTVINTYSMQAFRRYLIHSWNYFSCISGVHFSRGFHPKDEIPLINFILLQNSLSSGIQTLQNPKGDWLKNSIETIAQRSADHIRDQIRDVRGTVKERL